MNKLATLLCLSSTLLSSFAVQAGGTWKGNWLVGIDGGLVHDRGELDVTLLNSNGRQTVVTPRFQDDGWFLGILGGYQWQCNRWLLGAELNVDWFGDNDGDNNFAYTDASNVGWVGYSEYEHEWLIGLRGRIGYEIATYLLPYAVAGLEWTDDKLTYRQVNNSTPNATVLSGSSRDSSLRPVVGMGLEVPVPKWNCITLRFEYDYHFKAERIEVASIAATNGSVETVAASRKPYTQTVYAKAIWNFLK
ncbi:MAG: outer membrane protein [Candidatus Berkiella sp.]